MFGSVVQRQKWLMQREGLPRAEAYDKARKEFYDVRHTQDIERRVAKEEAEFVGAFWGKSAMQVGMQLEDHNHEDWREWALKEIVALKQLQGNVYTGLENEESVPELGDPATEEAMDELENVPATRKGQEALGDAVVHP